jgi:hypothetical protein
MAIGQGDYRMSVTMLQVTEEPVRTPETRCWRGSPLVTALAGYPLSCHGYSPLVPFPGSHRNRRVVLEQHLGEGCLTGVP